MFVCLCVSVSVVRQGRDVCTCECMYLCTLRRQINLFRVEIELTGSVKKIITGTSLVAQ